MKTNDLLHVLLQDSYYHGHAKLLVDSYTHWTGKHLINPQQHTEHMLQEIFYAPFVITSHGTEKDPVFNFCNLKALEIFEYSWDEFIQLPSRCSTEAINQDKRARFLERVKLHGFIDDYSGVRISSGGVRFFIQNATVWNLIDDQGQYMGQAAMFDQWRFV